MKKRIVYGGAAALTVALLLCLGYIFRHQLTDQPWRLKHFLRYTSFTDLGFCRCQPDKDFLIEQTDGLRIAASLYQKETGPKQPGILILHGNTPLGRNLAIYKVLAKSLSENGYRVMTIDFPGYGESSDPHGLNDPVPTDHSDGLNTANKAIPPKSVTAAVNYMKNLDTIDDRQIYVIGHSGGSLPALFIGMAEEIVGKIVLIGPPRRVKERSQNQADMAYFWERAQKTRLQVYNKPFPEWYTIEKFKKSFAAGDLSNYLSYLSSSNHIPLLLMDGEREDRSDREYLAAFYSKMSQPKAMITLKRSDHYCNIIGLLGFALYDRRVLSETVERIDRWLKRPI